ncbi:collagen alpha-1(XVIII) chain-like [Apteryx mantelli]|uniref:Collagen alpha-1(XVIII) chain-like n=1 Tax=Apteryx mantelli TaxID=2696672 RepID=A0ABM4EPF1_9AVES
MAQDEEGSGDVTSLQGWEPGPSAAVPTGNESVASTELPRVAEGTHSGLEQGDGNVTGMPESTVRPPTSIASTATPPIGTAPARSQDTTSSSTKGPHLLTTAGPELVLPEPTESLGKRKGTRVSLQRPVAPRPGSAPFPFSPGDGAHEQVVPPQEPFSGEGLGSLASPKAQPARVAPSRARDGASATPHSADHPELSPRASTRDRRPSAAFGLPHAALSATPPGDRSPKRSSSSQLLQGTGRPAGRWGLALAGVNGSWSPSAPNVNATNDVDFPPADNSDPLEFDLLTSTLRLYSSNSAGFASFFPGLTPEAGRCLPFPARLPYCTTLGTKHFRLPNYLSHGSEAEIRAALHEWEGLLKSRCHRYLEWFLCLLLVPGCNASVPITPPPCQGFCEAVRDLCWMHLAAGHLPLPCDSLPAEDGGYSCVFINVSAGNVAG